MRAILIALALLAAAPAQAQHHHVRHYLGSDFYRVPRGWYNPQTACDLDMSRMRGHPDGYPIVP
jgi:hypothetical protein